MSTVGLWTLATAGLAGGFGVLFLVARRVNNYGLVDIAWSPSKCSST